MSVWKACDIRGRFPEEVNATLAWRVGAAVATRLGNAARILVAGDFRISTPELKAALCAGLTHCGAEVLDAGLVPTPVAYFAHMKLKTDAVLIVTASHNPAEYNGIKLMVGVLPPTEEQLAELCALASTIAPIERSTRIRQVDLVPEYRAWVEARFWGSPRSLSVVLDAGNGAWAHLAPDIFRDLGYTVEPLFCEPDGRFPNRPPDCARSANLGALRKAVVRVRASLGIAWDGDGDRVAFVDEYGTVLSADEVSILLIRSLLKTGSAETVIYDIKLSDEVRKAILDAGGLPVMQRSGHAFIKRAMIERNAVLGCEASGHYFHRELGGGDDGLFSALLVSDLVSRHGTIKQRRLSLPPVFVTPDLRLPLRISLESIIARLRQALAPLREWDLNGVRMETGQGFVLVRNSVTEPMLTMRLDGRDGPALKGLIDTCLAVLPELSHEIEQQLSFLEHPYDT